jgi:hypothetical protein
MANDIRYEALTEPVDRTEIAVLKSQHRSNGTGPKRWGVGIFSTMGLGLITGCALIAFIWLEVIDHQPPPTALEFFFLVLFHGILGGTTLVCALVSIVVIQRYRHRWQELYRATTFASRNRLDYRSEVRPPTWTSDLFDPQGDPGPERVKQREADVFRSLSRPLFELGNYGFAVNRGNGFRTSLHAYIVVELGRDYGHLILRSLLKQSQILWRGDLSHYQKLSLGTPDLVFELLSSTGSLDDATRVFTPELIAALSAMGPGTDAEVVDGHLFMYPPVQFDARSQKSLQPAFDLIDLVRGEPTTAMAMQPTPPLPTVLGAEPARGKRPRREWAWARGLPPWKVLRFAVVITGGGLLLTLLESSTHDLDWKGPTFLALGLVQFPYYFWLRSFDPRVQERKRARQQAK